MRSQVTLTLADGVLKRAEILARRTGRPVADLLAETIELSLRPLGTPATDEPALADWPDADVLATAEVELPSAEDARLTDLLDRQQAGVLANGEHAELVALVERYQALLLRKAQALREAVRRGLRKPPEP